MSLHQEIHFEKEICHYLGGNDLIRERCTTLISAAVTGQIDVRT